MDLAADLAAGREARVYIHVSGAGSDGSYDLGEFTSQDPLACRVRTNNVGRRDGPSDSAGLRAWRSTGDWRRISLRLAELDHDAADDAPLPKVNVSLCHRSLQSTVRQLVVDGVIVVADEAAELTARHSGHRWHVLVTGQRGLDRLSLSLAYD
jgi:hypothetical protein